MGVHAAILVQHGQVLQHPLGHETNAPPASMGTWEVGGPGASQGRADGEYLRERVVGRYYTAYQENKAVHWLKNTFCDWQAEGSSLSAGYKASRRTYLQHGRHHTLSRHCGCMATQACASRQGCIVRQAFVVRQGCMLRHIC